jgi:hypothetical protein
MRQGMHPSHPTRCSACDLHPAVQQLRECRRMKAEVVHMPFVLQSHV